jgi:hypothetical protein
MELFKTETTLDYKVLTAEVNRRLGKEYGLNYITNIHKGIQQSADVKAAINEILSEASSTTTKKSA